MNADKHRYQTQSFPKPAPAKNNPHDLPDNLTPTIPTSAVICVHLRLIFGLIDLVAASSRWVFCGH
jgi:hypothetical protein